MIAKLTGKLIHKSVDYIIIDVNGVGYQLFVSLTTFYQLPEVESPVTLDTYLNVREDALVLYGFSGVEEKAIFLQLTSISGIGPKLGLGILSGISADELIDAIETQDVVRLVKIPGIGKKTAQRIVLELKDKMNRIERTSEKGELPRVGSGEQLNEDVISALVNLGYKKNDAEGALKIALKECGDDKSLEKLLRMSLNLISRK